MPQLIDTHCHVHFQAYKDDMTDIIDATLKKDVWMITVGTQKDTSKKGIDVAEKYSEGLYASVGLHPNHLFPVHIDEDETSFRTREEDFDYAYYKNLCASKKVVAIGECGLDYYRIPKTIDSGIVKEKQERVFRSHLDLADEMNLPVICHIRDAHDETLAILKEYVEAGKLSRRGVTHCFTGSALQAKAYTEIGFYVSFTGIITFVQKKHNNLQQEGIGEAVHAVPLENILVETDAPYLTPEPHRGERNLPEYVTFVAQKIADLKGVNVDDVATITTENAKRLFGI